MFLLQRCSKGDTALCLFSIIALAYCAPHSSDVEEVGVLKIKRAASSPTATTRSPSTTRTVRTTKLTTKVTRARTTTKPTTTTTIPRSTTVTTKPTTATSTTKPTTATSTTKPITAAPTTKPSTDAPTTKPTTVTPTTKPTTATPTATPTTATPSTIQTTAAPTTKLTTATMSAMTTSISSGCPSPSYSPDHTACLSVSPYAVNPRGITAVDKKLIVDLHNNLRGRQQATDMQLMVWDEEVAYVAQKWSDNCNYNHDSKRYIPGKYSAGQNIAYGFPTWNSTIMAWYNEVNQFTYGSQDYTFSDIGHYTQIVWNSTAKIGCGATTCTNLRGVFYVCNYAPAGNISPQIPTPYTQGTPCAACPGRCNNGLCDCGGLVCKNGGTLNLNTCQCTCQSPYTGLPDCNLNCTGVSDQWYCGTQWPASYCSRYYNVPYECPIMCSVCPAA